MTDHNSKSVTRGSIGSKLATNTVSNQFVCVKCDYICSKKSDFQKHISTRKHLSRHKVKEKVAKVAKVARPDSPVYTCPCGKIFKTHGGLWKHKQRCNGERCGNS